MNEALRFFLDDEKVREAEEYPDNGMDYIFMLQPSDWEHLCNVWNDKDMDWKITLTYFAGFVALEQSCPLLSLAINDQHKEIVGESILSFHNSLTDEFNPPFELPEHTKTQILSNMGKYEALYPQIKEMRNVLMG